MRSFASCCIDTSDGVCAALNTIADLNACGYVVAELPYLRAGLGFCRRASLPEELLFLGECGEYELLFTVRRERDEAFLIQARKSGCQFRRIGTITATGRKLLEDDRTIDLESWDRQARDFDSPAQYLAALRRWLDRQQAVGGKIHFPGRS